MAAKATNPQPSATIVTTGNVTGAYESAAANEMKSARISDKMNIMVTSCEFSR